MNTWHCFERATGRLTGSAFRVPDADLAGNIPEGCGVVLGVTDWTTQRVVVGVDGDGAERLTVVWDASVVPLDDLKAKAATPVLETLQQLDVAARRPVEEISLAQALGDTPPAAVVSRLQSIATEKAELRALLAAIAAATTPEELAAVLGHT